MIILQSVSFIDKAFTMFPHPGAKSFIAAMILFRAL